MLRDRGTPQGPKALGGFLCYSGVRSRLLVFARVRVHGGSGGALSLLGDIQSHLENLHDSVPCLSGLATLSANNAEASSWLSAVDMVAARIPARMQPATTAGKMP